MLASAEPPDPPGADAGTAEPDPAGNPDQPRVEEEITEPSIEDRQQEDKEFEEEFERLAKLDEEWRDYMAQNS